jgi:hypothetical protein
MLTIKYRLVEPQLRPRRTKLEMPGWGGKPEPRKDGSHEQVWHCMPFTEGAQYGIELFYPYATELRVTKQNGEVVLDGDFGPDPGNGLNWPPFRTFGENYYTYQLLLDLKVPNDMAVRTEPHPRYYTDPANETPLAVPALIRSEWWPMMFFCIFKAPPKGVTHVFRKGEPFMSVITIPAEPELDLQPMDEEEEAERELRARRIAASRDALAQGARWTSSTNTVFDGAYRHMARAAKARDRAAG